MGYWGLGIGDWGLGIWVISEFRTNHVAECKQLAMEMELLKF